MKKALLLFFLFIGSQVVAACSVVVLCQVLSLALESSAALQVYAIAFFGLLTVALLWHFGLLRHRMNLRQSQFGALQLALLAFGVLAVVWGLSMLLTPLNLDDGGSMALFSSVAHNPLALLILVLVGPLLEETFFRAGIARQLVIGGMRPHVAAVLTALLFAVVHFNLAQAIPAFVVGYLFTLCYFATGNILLCGLLHIVNNGLAVLLLLYPSLGERTTFDNAAKDISAGVVLMLIGFILTFSIVHGFLKKRETLQKILGDTRGNDREISEKLER